MIDLLFVNNSHRIVDSGVIPVHLSDHSLIYGVLKAGIPRAPPRTTEYRSFKHFSKQAFLADLTNVNWSLVDIEPDIDATVNNWNTLFTEMANQHAPIKQSRVKGIHMPWLTSELCSLMQERDFDHRKAVKSNSSHHWKMFRNLKNKVNMLVKKSKADHYRNLIDNNKGNSGELWKSLNKITSRKSTSYPSCIEADNVSNTDPVSIEKKKKVDSYKYLGVTVNQRMNWTDHIDSITSKVGQRLGLVRRVKHLLPMRARLTLYNSLIMPLFDNADIVWGDKNNVQLMNHLQVMQNNAARLILDFPARASGTQALELLKWQPLHLRRFYHRCLMVFKYKNGNVDFNFGIKKNELHGYSTQRRNDYHLPCPPPYLVLNQKCLFKCNKIQLDHVLIFLFLYISIF